MIPILEASELASTLNANSGRRQIEETLIAFDDRQITSKTNRSKPQPGNPAYTLNSTAPLVASSTGDGYWREDETAGTIRGREQESHEHLVASTGEVSHCLNAGGMGRIDYETETLVTHSGPVFFQDSEYGAKEYETGGGLRAGRIPEHCMIVQPEITHALRADGFDASEDGTGRGTPLVAATIDANYGKSTGRRAGKNSGVSEGHLIAFSSKDSGADAGDISPTLRAMGHDQSHPNAGGQVAVTVSLRGREGGATAELGDEKAGALRAGGGGGDKAHVMERAAVRRLTPLECERLQGFTDSYTAVNYKGKPMADGPRYKALGNSMAVPVMAYIGARIMAVDKALNPSNPGEMNE